jgi:hypothetical protein
MRSDGLIVAGQSTSGDTPDWVPLENLALEHCCDFMWMFTVEAEHGRRIQAYKHIWTRRYIHLDGTGAAFVFRRDGRYQQVDALWLIDLVLERSAAIPWSEQERDRVAELGE